MLNLKHKEAAGSSSTTNPQKDGPNFIPEDAIKNSEELKKSRKIEKALALQKGKTKRPGDEYNEERVSPDEPSREEVKRSPPDDTVKPG